MKTFHLLVLALCLACPGIEARAENDPGASEPVIKKIRGKRVTVRVPEGFDRVTLQQRLTPKKVDGVKTERWRTLATGYPRGAETQLEFQIPKLVGKKYLRVFGNREEQLDGSLLTGFTQFLADPILPADSGSGNPAEFTTTGNGLLSSRTDATSFAAGDSSRAVVESDIWKVEGDRLYFFNELRGLQVFDLSKLSEPALLGTMRLPGAGEQMYLLESGHAVLLKRSPSHGYLWNDLPFVRISPITTFDGLLGSGVAGSVSLDASSAAAGGLAISQQPQTSASGEIIVADVGDGAPRLVARVPYEGQLMESRLVGSVLYLASNVNRAARDAVPAQQGLQLASFDLADPEQPVQRASIFLGGYANAVTATDRFFLIAKHPAGSQWQWNQSVVDLIDISAPDGAMTRRGQVAVAGAVPNKFNMHIDGAALTVVAQWWGSVEINQLVRWTSVTKLQTFSISDPDAPAPLAVLDIAPGETVRAVRFDGEVAYVVTFEQIDPLFVVDLRDPATPLITGHVEAPGFSTYIEPLGDRLVTVGLLDWKPAVSLFDVSDPAAPKLLSQLKLGGSDQRWSSSEAVWNEKAFKVLPEENLVMLPVTSHGAESGWFGSVQLIDLLPDRLVKRGAIVHPFSPRRATMVRRSIVAISPTRLVTVNAEDRDLPVVKADLEIAWRVDRLFSVADFLVQIGGSADWLDRQPPRLMVSRANAPEEIRSSIELANAAVLGATVVEEVLYVAQGQPQYDYYWVERGETDKQPLTISAYDLSRLPAVRLLGSTTTLVRINGSELAPHWPTPGILVWSGTVSRSWWRNLRYEPMATPTLGDETVEARIVAPDYWTTQWQRAQAIRLFAFDVRRPEQPKFLSNLNVGIEKPWEVSGPFAAEGMLHLSYRDLGKAHPYELMWTAEGQKLQSAAGDDLPDDPAVQRTNKHYLVRLDYTEPGAPVLDETNINLPGRLVGLRRGGRLLLTAGQGYDLETASAKAGEAALHSSALQGAQAHLIDVAPLANATQPLVVMDAGIFTLDVQPQWLWTYPDRLKADDLTGMAVISSIWWWGVPSLNEKQSVLSRWSVNDQGRFSKVGESFAEHDQALHLFPGLAVTSDQGRSLRLFDTSRSDALEPVGSYTFDGWVWPNLQHADGGSDRGFWVPLGAYGVETVAEPAAQ